MLPDLYMLPDLTWESHQTRSNSIDRIDSVTGYWVHTGLSEPLLVASTAALYDDCDIEQRYRCEYVCRILSKQEALLTTAGSYTIGKPFKCHVLYSIG